MWVPAADTYLEVPQTPQNVRSGRQPPRSHLWRNPA